MSDIEAQMQRARREAMRWYLLQAVHVSRPYGMYTEPLLAVVQAVYPDATHREVRVQLDYLEDRGLTTIRRDAMDRWMCDLTREGVDLVEYTTDCEPGIARPVMTRV